MAGTFGELDILDHLRQRRLQQQLLAAQAQQQQQSQPNSMQQLLRLAQMIGRTQQQGQQAPTAPTKPSPIPGPAPTSPRTPPTFPGPMPKASVPVGPEPGRPLLKESIDQPAPIGPVLPPDQNLQRLPPPTTPFPLGTLPPVQGFGVDYKGANDPSNTLSQIQGQQAQAQQGTGPTPETQTAVNFPQVPSQIQNQDPQAQAQRQLQVDPLPPEQIAYQQSLGQQLPNIDDPRFKPGFGRRLLSILGGVGTGYLTGSLPYGESTASHIAHPGYYKQMETINRDVMQKQAAAEAAMKGFEAQRKAGLEASTMNLQDAQAAQARAEAAARTKKATEYVPTTHQDMLDQERAKVRPFPNEPVIFEAKDGTQAVGFFNPNDGLYYDRNGLKLTDERQKDIESGNIKLHKLGTKEEIQKQTTVQERVQTLKSMYRVKYGKDPEGQALLDILNTADQEASGAKRDPQMEAIHAAHANILSQENVQSTAKLMENDPDLYNAKGFVPNDIKKPVANEFYRRVGFYPPKELKAADESASRIAYRSHDATQRIMQILHDNPRLFSFIGVALGRAGNLEMKAIHDIPQMPDDLKPAYAELKGQWERLAVREVMNLGQGNRFGAYLLHAVQPSIPNLAWNEQMFMGGLKAIQDDALDSIHSVNRTKYTDKYVDKYEAKFPVSRQYIVHPDANGHMQFGPYKIQKGNQTFLWNDKLDRYMPAQ